MATRFHFASLLRCYIQHFRLAAILLASVVVLPNSAVAQAVGLGSISGTVTDESGAALPGATLKLTSPALQVPEIVTVSDGQGRYRFGELRVGVYRVQAELDGFRMTIREKIDIPADFVARIDLTMALGSLNETITVSGASPVVDLSTTRGGQIIRAEAVARVLPMSGTPADMARVLRKNNMRWYLAIMRPCGPADIHGAARSALASPSPDCPWAGDGRWAPA